MATDCVPTPPPAPALLVTTTGCLTSRSMAAASGRAVRSAMPPGGNGTTIVIGRVGYGSWAATGSATRSRTSASRAVRRVVMRLSVRWRRPSCQPPTPAKAQRSEPGSAVRAVTDQLQQVAVGVQEVEALVVAPVDRGMVRNVALAKQALRVRVVFPRDLERMMTLAERVLDLVQAARRAVGLEEQGAASLAVGQEHLVVQAHAHRHAEHARVEQLGAREIRDVDAEVIEPPDPHAVRI